MKKLLWTLPSLVAIVVVALLLTPTARADNDPVRSYGTYVCNQLHLDYTLTSANVGGSSKQVYLVDLTHWTGPFAGRVPGSNYRFGTGDMIVEAGGLPATNQAKLSEYIQFGRFTNNRTIKYIDVNDPSQTVQTLTYW